MSFRPNIPSRFIVPSSAANLSQAAGAQKLRAATAGDRGWGGGLPSGPHRFLESNANPVVTSALRVALFADAGFSQYDLHEHYPVFGARQRANDDPQAVITFTVFQLVVLFELMYNTALSEYQSIRDDYSSRGAPLPAHVKDPRHMSEQQLDRLVSLTVDDRGLYSVLAFLSRRYILRKFNFLGVQWTNIFLSQPEGPGVTLITEGHCYMKNHCMAPTKEGDHVTWLLKRRQNARGEYGAFAMTMHPVKHASGLSPMEDAYKDIGDYLQFGVQLPFASIVEKEEIDPRAEDVLMASGLAGTQQSMAGSALNLPKLVVNLHTLGYRSVFVSY
jgi:hypothetical protein